jgi:hypothetical protein
MIRASFSAGGGSQCRELVAAEVVEFAMGWSRVRIELRQQLLLGSHPRGGERIGVLVPAEARVGANPFQRAMWMGLVQSK